jgi:hypothetical protein
MSASQNRCTEYLAKAEEAQRKALSARDPQARRTWDQIAQYWQDLAEQVVKADKL